MGKYAVKEYTGKFGVLNIKIINSIQAVNRKLKMVWVFQYQTKTTTGI